MANSLTLKQCHFSGQYKTVYIRYFNRFSQGSCTNEDQTGKMERLFLSALQQREGGATGPYAVQKVVTVFVRAVAVVVCESQNPPGELHHGGSPEEI